MLPCFSSLLLHIYTERSHQQNTIHIYTPAPGFPIKLIPRVTHSISITVWSIFSPDPSPFVHLIGIMIINTIMSFFLIYRVWDTLQLISLRVCFFLSFFFSPPGKKVPYPVSFLRINTFSPKYTPWFFFGFFYVCTYI